MRVNWRKPLSFLLALCLMVGLCPTLAAPAFAADGDFSISSSGKTLMKYNGPGGDVVIPDGVTTIGNRAFNGCATVTSVTIPDGVTSIEEYCFWNCTSLKTVVFPEGLTELGDYCFSDCSSLTSVTLPQGVKTLGRACFKNCTSLASVTLPQGIEALGDECFYRCWDLTGVTLPEGIKTLGDECFSICSSLRSVTLPKGITAVPSSCFQSCSSLTSVTLPEGLTEIDRYAFSYCTSLAGINIPDTVKTLGNNAFEKTALTGIELPKDLTSLGSRCFYESKSLTDVTLPEGLETIGEFCFLTTNVTKLTIPASVTRLETQSSLSPKEITFAAKDLSGLTAYNIPSNVKVYVQPGTVRPEWLSKATVAELGEKEAPYKLLVSGIENGQMSLGSFTITNGSTSARTISIQNMGTETLRSLAVQTSTPDVCTVSIQEGLTLAPTEIAGLSISPKSDLKSGSYTAEVKITADGLTPVTFKANFTVNAITCLSLAPAALDFGTVYAGGAQPAAQTVTVKAEDHAVNLQTPNLPEHFTCTMSKPQLAKGGTTTVTIQPKADLAAGTYKERVYIECSADRSGRSVEVQFTVKAKPKFTFSVTEMDFGTGKQGFRPQPQVVNVTNAGSSMATITKATLTGDGFEYSRGLLGGYEISAGKTIEEIVGVRPKEGLDDGTYTGTLEFEIEDGTKYTIPLKYVVNGVSTLSASPNKLDFGSVAAGNYIQPAAQTVTLTNTGKTPVTLEAPTSTDYVLGALSRTTLAAGQTATFTIQPKAGLEARGYATTVTVKTAQGDTAVVFLSFKVDGTSFLSASPDKLDFGTVAEGYTQPDAQTVTLTNTGKDPLTLQAPTSANYDLGSLSRTTLAAGQTSTFTVRPKAELKNGAYTEQITVKTEQGDSAAVSASFQVGKKGPTFTDVKETDWFYEDVEYAHEKGLVNGVGNNRFNPYGTTTRAQIVTILYRLEGQPPVSGRSTFADVPTGQYYSNAVKWAADNKIVNGYSSAQFAPNDPITREQMAAILYRYAGYKGYSTSARASLSKYVDARSIGSYATDAMSWANSCKLINGTSGTTLEPKGSATRAQVAAILHRFCENIAQ